MDLNIRRLLRHLFAPSAKRLFPAHTLERIAAAIATGELRHRGEVCFTVDAALHPRAVIAGQQARDRALEAFAQLRVWDTQANNGVLIYLLLAERRIEIVADRGLDGLVSAGQWRAVCQLIEAGMRSGAAEAAVIAGVQATSDLLAAHFPRAAGDQDHNELPDLPRILR